MAAEREARIAREKTNSAVVVRPRAERYALLRAGDGKLLAASALAPSCTPAATAAAPPALFDVRAAARATTISIPMFG